MGRALGIDVRERGFGEFVVDVRHDAQQQLIKNGWKGTEQPKIGRDGKWQLNLYDPDDTRIELMEFTPTQKPCCSDYSGPHPKP